MCLIKCDTINPRTNFFSFTDYQIDNLTTPYLYSQAISKILFTINYYC